MGARLGADLWGRGRLDLDDLDGSHRPYGSQGAYAASKLATVLLTREIARRAHGTGVTASSFRPGALATDIGRDNTPLTTATVLTGTPSPASAASTPRLRLNRPSDTSVTRLRAKVPTGVSTFQFTFISPSAR
ncbi:SDR family NAD(P)-dependent oxidoreductase [Streptomyces sp. NPDC005474]|uniref:SDR family NAD(P)-dependent oxidoreductase n=1 Tax=Streptomyces sp. NPDC005474 TaxID=3154878 RepID=UPI0034525AE3